MGFLQIIFEKSTTFLGYVMQRYDFSFTEQKKSEFLGVYERSHHKLHTPRCIGSWECYC
jgi:hypothetical protein